MQAIFSGIPKPANPTIWLMSIGKRIRSLRLTKGMKQGELAGRIGIKQASLSEIEHGHTAQPAGDTLLKLAVALDTNPHWIQTGRGSPVLPTETTPDESEAIALFRALPDQLRAAWLAAGRSLLAHSPAKASKTKPFPATVK